MVNVSAKGSKIAKKRQTARQTTEREGRSGIATITMLCLAQLVVSGKWCRAGCPAK